MQYTNLPQRATQTFACPKQNAFLLSLLFVLASICLHAQQTDNPIAKLVREKQQQAAFKPVSILKKMAPEKKDGRALNMHPAITHASLDKAGLRQLYQQNEVAVDMAIPFKDKVLEVELVQVELFAPDFKITENDGAEKEVPFQPGRFYRGIVKGDEHSMVTVSIFENELYGIVSTAKTGNINIVKARIDATGKEQASADEYMIYSEKEMDRKMPFSCTTPEEGFAKSLAGFDPTATTESAEPCWNKYIGVYFECDSAFVANQGGIYQAVNYMSALFNNTAAIYWFEGISMRISWIYIWTATDDYAVYNGISDQAERVEKKLDLFALKRKYIGTGLIYKTTIAQLITDSHSTAGNGIGGKAKGIDGLCQPKNIYSMSELNGAMLDTNIIMALPRYSWDVYCVTHEIGHTLGSWHTQSCCWPGGAIDGCVESEHCWELAHLDLCNTSTNIPSEGGTIMSYCHQGSIGVNFAKGFGPLPGALIRQKVCNAAGCLQTSWDCDPPTNVKAKYPTSCSIWISWDTKLGVNYNLRYRRAFEDGSSNDWIYANAILPNYEIKGLAANTYYDVQLQTNCGYYSLYGYGTMFKTACDAPEVKVLYADDHSAELSWTGGDNSKQYGIEYRENGNIYSTECLGKGITLDFLKPDTKYEGFVVNQCECGDSGPAWFQFKTEKLCPAPEKLTATATCKSITVDWEKHPNAQSYVLIYRTVSSTYVYGETYSISGVIPPFTLLDLEPTRTYEIEVKPACSQSPNASARAKIFTNVSVLIACCPPENLKASAVNATSATLSWDATTSPYFIQYVLFYRKKGTTTSSAIINQKLTSRVVTKLTPGTAYEFRVMTVCSSGNTFTNWVSFNTPSAFSGDGAGTAPRSDDTPGSSVAEMTLTPNPAAETCTVTLSAMPEIASAPGRVDIFDVVGKCWKTIDWNDPSTALHINLFALPAGSYFLVFTDDRQQRLQKLLIKQ